MSKEFIPYEQALELKQLGFNELCLFYYADNEALRIYHQSEIYDDLVGAPLYQQAFRWFREKYGLYSAVNVDQTMEPKFAYCISKYWTDALSWGWDTIVFNSDLYYDYEETELDCLKKLIEIVKNDTNRGNI
jgi:hypothetical protein